MKQYQLLRDGSKNAWTLTDVTVPQPQPNQVVIRIHAASLNYRDLLIARNAAQRTPIVPCSDGAGEVVEIGSNVTRLKIGDRVMAAFFQTWLDGPINADVHAHALGGAVDGVLSEYVVLDQHGLVRIPDFLSYAEAATLPCAALTAWNGLFESGNLQPGETVLLIGTGGVSTFALQFAHVMGATVLQLSSSDDKLQKATSLGAHHTLNYRNHPDWSDWVLDITSGRGVDQVIEVGGAGTLDKSLRAVRHAGTVSLTGVLTGYDGLVSPLPALMKSLRLQGIYVGSRAMFERMIDAICANNIHPVIDRVFRFDQAPAALQYLQSAQHTGKVVINVH